MRYGLRVGRNKRQRRYGARTNSYRHVPAGFGVVWLVAAACRNFASLRYGLRMRYGLRLRYGRTNALRT